MTDDDREDPADAGIDAFIQQPAKLRPHAEHGQEIIGRIRRWDLLHLGVASRARQIAVDGDEATNLREHAGLGTQIVDLRSGEHGIQRAISTARPDHDQPIGVGVG